MRFVNRSVSKMKFSPIHLKSFLSIPFNGRGPGYSCMEILANMAHHDLYPSLTVPYSYGPVSEGVKVTNTMKCQWGKLVYRYAPWASERATEATFLHNISANDHDVAYLWGETTLDFSFALKRLGVKVVREKTNCGKALAKRILDDAYRRVDAVPQHGITDKAVVEEEIRLKLADAIYCPNAMVEASLREIGIPDSVILSTSYGYSASRLKTDEKLLEPIDGVTFVFVGTICVRKGAHLILDAWARSGIKGRLVLAGGIEPLIEKISASQLARPDVVRLNYVKNVGALYNSSDVFVFPTLEEGGPQVTYEAAACGVPAIVSPMGAGRIIRPGKEGFVVDPYDADGWIDAMREIAENESLRKRLAAGAYERSVEFTWPCVGASRRDLLMRMMDKASS